MLAIKNLKGKTKPYGRWSLKQFLIMVFLLMTACSSSAESNQNQIYSAINMSDSNEKITLPSPVREFVEAVNRGDEEAFLSFFDEEKGVIDDWGRVFTGHKQIKAWSDKEFIGAKGIITPTKTEIDGNKISLWAGWKSEYYSGDSKFIFTVDDQNIKEMKIVSAK